MRLMRSEMLSKLFVVCLHGYYLIVSLASAHKNNVCQASHSLSLYSTYHSYPLDIYKCGENHLGNSNCNKDGSLGNCFSIEKQYNHFNHTCAIPSEEEICPINQHYVDVALQRSQSWIQGSVLCNLKAAITNPLKHESLNNEINVIVLGGSVTVGVTTQGCCSADICSKDAYYGTNEYCNWVAYLGRWLSTMDSNIRTFNLAHAGYNSDTYKDKMFEKLNLIRQNFMFKKSDLVLLDLSVNDANTFEGDPNKMFVLEKGLEALIRRIYWLSEPNSMPTIILLEMWVGHLPQASYDPTAIYPDIREYTVAYEKIARHYNISIWSYRDLVVKQYNKYQQFKSDEATSPLNSHYQQRPPYLDYLSFRNNYKDSSGHPPWHVHLFYADLISAIIQSQLHTCNEVEYRDNNNNSNINSSESEMLLVADTITRYPTIKSPHMLPAPLIPHTFLRCDTAAPLLLDITAPYAVGLRAAAANTAVKRTVNDDVGNKEEEEEEVLASTITNNHTSSYAIEEENIVLGSHKGDPEVAIGVPVFQSYPSTAWQLRVDSKQNRPGFIHEYNIHDSRIEENILVFRLNVTHEEFISSKDYAGAQMLQLLYLRTYANAGKVKVLLCGNEIRDGRYEPVVLDALWGDYSSFHYSLPEVYSIELPKGHCSKTERKDDTGEKFVTVELVTKSWLLHAAAEEKIARGNEKFKLVEVKHISRNYLNYSNIVESS